MSHNPFKVVDPRIKNNWRVVMDKKSMAVELPRPTENYLAVLKKCAAAGLIQMIPADDKGGYWTRITDFGNDALRALLMITTDSADPDADTMSTQ
jgi:hypothetical protein